MPSWAIVGATRGIGFEYVNQLSSDPLNEVFALIRRQKTAGPLNELAASRKNIHVLETDIANPTRLKETAENISNITSGKLDVLVYNAFFHGDSAELTPSAFAGREEELESHFLEPLKVNVLHAIHSVNAFLSLIKQGTERKIIYISSVSGDIEVNRISELSTAVGYSASKAAGAIVMAKYASELKADGIFTLSISPGWVETDSAKGLLTSPDVFDATVSALRKFDPNVKGMISPKESVESMLSVIRTLDSSNSGKFLSHKGNLDWF
ncbi:NAD(P)-binding protein [Trichoderma chlorosporum]